MSAATPEVAPEPSRTRRLLGSRPARRRSVGPEQGGVVGVLPGGPRGVGARVATTYGDPLHPGRHLRPRTQARLAVAHDQVGRAVVATVREAERGRRTVPARPGPHDLRGEHHP